MLLFVVISTSTNYLLIPYNFSLFLRCCHLIFTKSRMYCERCSAVSGNSSKYFRVSIRAGFIIPSQCGHLYTSFSFCCFLFGISFTGIIPLIFIILLFVLLSPLHRTLHHTVFAVWCVVAHACLIRVCTLCVLVVWLLLPAITTRF